MNNTMIGPSQKRQTRGGNGAGGVRVPRPAVLLTLMALTMAVSAPSAAQQDRELVAWEVPLHAAPSTVFVNAAAGDTESVHAAASGPALTGRVTTCRADQTAGSTWNATIGGSVTAQRSVRNVRVRGYIEPGRRQIGNQLLGRMEANQTRTFHMTGTVSGATPTGCEVRATSEESQPPDPDPDPPPTAGCRPTTTALRFDGGYDVSMCYRTPAGDVGQAKSGVWASGQSGILWFFDRGNAEVLVKVLDGCTHNGHRWAFVAPVTTLEFNLWITGPDGKRWTHSNRQGQTASTKSDNRAFACATDGDDDNDGDDSDDDGDDDEPTSAPDLVVSSPSVSDSSLSAGDRFTLRATVRNQGDGRSAATTLRYYRSSNSSIGTSDTQVGTDSVGVLSASSSSAESISLTAPSSAGTYYYGACVDSVSGESNTGNNCSSGVRVTVSGGGGSGTRYNVGDVITTLPSDSWSLNGGLSRCSLSNSGGKTNVRCSRNGYVERRPYRYTCDASTCRIEGRTVTAGTWVETRR